MKKMWSNVSVSVDEICKYLEVGKDTVYLSALSAQAGKWTDKHGMPAHRMGRLWKLKKDQVDAWVEAGGAATQEYNKE